MYNNNIIMKMVTKHFFSHEACSKRHNAVFHKMFRISTLASITHHCMCIIYRYVTMECLYIL